MTPGMKRGLLMAAIAGGLGVAPACANAQEQLLVTATVGNDLGVGIFKIFENKGFLGMDLGVPLGDDRSSNGSLMYGDIGGGFRSGAIVIAGILGLAVGRENCAGRPPCEARPVYSGTGADEPERWHPVGFRAGVGVMVFGWEDVTLGAKAVHGDQGGRYSAWLGFVLEDDKW